MYRINGNKLTHNGHEVHLFGSNWIGLELKESALHGPWGGVTYRDMIQQMKSLQHNAVRLPITTKTIQNVPVSDGDIGSGWIKGHEVLAGKRSMEVLDHVISELESAGIRYFFDMHYLKADGKLPGIWYTPEYSEAQWLSDMKTLASRYKGKPGFIGIDILNEPNKDVVTWNTGDARTDWKLASERAFEAINSVNQDIVVIVEAMSTEGGISQLRNPKPNIPDDRISYSIHLYGPDVWSDFGEGFKDSSFPQNMPKVWDRIFGNDAKQVNVIIGEFGGKYGQANPKDKAWQDAFVGYLKANKISSLYWGFTDSSGWDTGGIQSDGGFRNLRQDKVGLLRTLVTPETRHTQATMERVSGPIISEVTVPSTTPSAASVRYNPGDFVRFRTGEGPKGIVQKVTANNATVAFPPYEVRVVPLEYLIKV